MLRAVLKQIAGVERVLTVLMSHCPAIAFEVIHRSCPKMSLS